MPAEPDPSEMCTSGTLASRTPDQGTGPDAVGGRSYPHRTGGVTDASAARTARVSNPSEWGHSLPASLIPGELGGVMPRRRG